MSLLQVALIVILFYVVYFLIIVIRWLEALLEAVDNKLDALLSGIFADWFSNFYLLSHIVAFVLCFYLAKYLKPFVISWWGSRKRELFANNPNRWFKVFTIGTFSISFIEIQVFYSQFQSSMSWMYAQENEAALAEVLFIPSLYIIFLSPASFCAAVFVLLKKYDKALFCFVLCDLYLISHTLVFIPIDMPWLYIFVDISIWLAAIQLIPGTFYCLSFVKEPSSDTVSNT